MPNPFIYCELHTADPAAAKSFYGRLFDWKLKDSQTPGGLEERFEPKPGRALADFFRRDEAEARPRR
ncbi:MAG: VOC family protein [Acidobacteriota bacterium]